MERLRQWVSSELAGLAEAGVRLEVDVGRCCDRGRELRARLARGTCAFELAPHSCRVAGLGGRDRPLEQIEDGGEVLQHEFVVGGDVNYFEELITRYQPRVFGMARKYFCNESDVEDVVQTIFTKTFQTIRLIPR